MRIRVSEEIIPIKARLQFKVAIIYYMTQDENSILLKCQLFMYFYSVEFWNFFHK